MCDIIWPPAPFKLCYLARNPKEVAQAWPTLYKISTLAFLQTCTTFVTVGIYLFILYMCVRAGGECLRVFRQVAPLVPRKQVYKGDCSCACACVCVRVCGRLSLTTGTLSLSETTLDTTKGDRGRPRRRHDTETPSEYFK